MIDILGLMNTVFTAINSVKLNNIEEELAPPSNKPKLNEAEIERRKTEVKKQRELGNSAYLEKNR
jgi:hypothetical protein